MGRRLLLVLAFVVLAATLSACGGEADQFEGVDPLPPAEPAAQAEESEPAPQPAEVAPAEVIEPSPEARAIASAAVATTESGSAQMEMFFSMLIPGLEKPVAFEMDGVFDFVDQRGHMNMDFSGFVDALGPAAAGAADALPDQLIFDDLVMYMHFPGLSELLPGATPWVRMDLEELTAMQGIDLNAYSQFSQTDPSQTLQYLQAVSSDVVLVGEEKVRGVKTTHYRTTIDLERIPESLPEEQREALGTSYEQLIEQVGQSTLPMDVWIDKKGRARRISSKMSFPVTGTSAPGTAARWTMELFDFGVEVNVTPPPAGEVTDFTDLFLQAG